MKKITLFLFYIIFLVNISGYELEVKKTNWTIVFGYLDGNDLSLSNQYLVSTIPDYLESNVVLEYDHFLSKEEESGVYQDLIQDNIGELKKKRLTEINKRDQLLFQKEQNPDEYSNIEKNILEVEEDIVSLEQTDLTTLDPIKSLKPEILDDLDLSAVNNIERFINHNKIDYYITGNLEEEGENLFITISLYSKYAKDPEILYSGVGSNEDVLGFRDDIVDIINRKIVAKPILNYEIIVEPSDALIYIDEEFKGIERYKGYTFEDRRVKIQVIKDGYESIVIEKVVTDENSFFKYELQEKKLDYINITSKPTGANVYYGSKFMGLTPLEIPILSNPQKLSLSLEGYMDESVTIKEDVKDMHFIMDSNVIDVDKNFIKHKNNFYLSLGVFSISLAVPLFFYSQSDIITFTEDMNLYTNISVINATLWGIHLVYRLYRYLEAAKLSVK